MIRLVSELAEAPGRVERAIALGEAIPRLERLRAMLLIGMVGACLVLAAGYIHLNQEISTIRSNQQKAIAARLQAQSERHQILQALHVGKERAEG